MRAVLLLVGLALSPEAEEEVSPISSKAQLCQQCGSHLLGGAGETSNPTVWSDAV